MILPLFEPEIKANLLRADDSIAAAKLLYREQHFDFAAARAYYAAFYAATAALLNEAREYQKHSGVIERYNLFNAQVHKKISTGWQ